MTVILKMIIVWVYLFLGTTAFSAVFSGIECDTIYITFSRNAHFVNTDKSVSYPIKAQVTNDKGAVMSNTPVYFEFIDIPSGTKDCRITPSSTITNNAGIAEATVFVSAKEGTYIVVAKTEIGCINNNALFKLNVRRSNWMLFLILGIIGGLVLFVMGTHLINTGMQKSAGEKMHNTLNTLTHNKFSAFFTGAFSTLFLQSSNATSVMLVGLVNTRLMRFRQTIGIILGAFVGATLTVQLIAFKVNEYGLLIIAIGFMIQAFSKTSVYKDIGQTILGLGILFFSMKILADSITPLRTYPPFLIALSALNNPVAGIIIGLLFTFMIQSSSAFMGILIVMGTQGFMTLETIIPLMIGSNLGTAISPIIASFRTSKESKKVALAHLLFKFIGLALFIWCIPFFAYFLKWFTFTHLYAENTEAYVNSIPRLIANAHTFYNIAIAIVVLPMSSVFINLINKLIPVKENEKELKLEYLNQQMISSPNFAVQLAKQETIRMLKNIHIMTEAIIIPFLYREKSDLNDIEQRKAKVVFLQKHIQEYLLQVMRQNASKHSIDNAFRIMHVIKEFDQIADIVGNSMLEKAKIWSSGKALDFSEQGKQELAEYHKCAVNQLSLAIDTFQEVSSEKVKELKKKYKSYTHIAIEFDIRHFERLKEQVKESVETSTVHLELMNMLSSVTHHATSISKILLKETISNGVTES